MQPGCLPIDENGAKYCTACTGGLMRTWQVQEARRQFRQLFDDAVERGPQRIARQGKRSVVVVSVEEGRRLSESVPSFGELLASCPIAPGDLPKRRAARAIRQHPFG